MNHFSYETMAKDKIRGLMEEGMRSQAAQGFSSQKRNLLRSLPRLILLLLIVLGLFSLLWH